MNTIEAFPKEHEIDEGSAYRLATPCRARSTMRSACDALGRYNARRAVKGTLGERFIAAVTQVKETELDAYQRVISSWEREHFLLNV